MDGKDIPIAEYTGKVKVGDKEIPCAVLYPESDNPIRVFWQRGRRNLYKRLDMVAFMWITAVKVREQGLSARVFSWNSVSIPADRFSSDSMAFLILSTTCDDVILPLYSTFSVSIMTHLNTIACQKTTLNLWTINPKQSRPNKSPTSTNCLTRKIADRLKRTTVDNRRADNLSLTCLIHQPPASEIIGFGFLCVCEAHERFFYGWLGRMKFKATCRLTAPTAHQIDAQRRLGEMFLEMMVKQAAENKLKKRLRESSDAAKESSYRKSN